MRFALAFLLIFVVLASVIAAPSDSSPHNRAVRQLPSPSGFDPSGSIPGGDTINSAKDKVKQQARDIASKVPKPRTGRR